MVVNNEFADGVYGKGRGQYQLPCGYVDGDGKIHRLVTLRELSGVEEDMLDDDEVPVNQRVTDVLAACCEKIGDVTDPKVIKSAIGDTLERGLPLTAADRIAMMLYLRRVSVGDLYKFERRCPYCRHVNKNKSLDLQTVDITYVDDPTKRRVSFKLRRSGLKVTLRVLSASGEEKLADLRPTTKDVRTLAILARLDAIDDKLVDQSSIHEITQVIKNLPVKDRNQIRNVYNMIEGAVDTDVEVECNNPICRTSFSFPLDLGQVFFSSPEEKVTMEDLEWL